MGKQGKEAQRNNDIAVSVRCALQVAFPWSATTVRLVTSLTKVRVRLFQNRTASQMTPFGDRIFHFASPSPPILIRSDFREGDEDSNFQFSESGGSLKGPNLFMGFPFM